MLLNFTLSYVVILELLPNVILLDDILTSFFNTKLTLSPNIKFEVLSILKFGIYILTGLV